MNRRQVACSLLWDVCRTRGRGRLERSGRGSAEGPRTVRARPVLKVSTDQTQCGKLKRRRFSLVYEADYSPSPLHTGIDKPVLNAGVRRCVVGGLIPPQTPRPIETEGVGSRSAEMVWGKMHHKKTSAGGIRVSSPFTTSSSAGRIATSSCSRVSVLARSGGGEARC